MTMMPVMVVVVVVVVVKMLAMMMLILLLTMVTTLTQLQNHLNFGRPRNRRQANVRPPKLLTTGGHHSRSQAPTWLPPQNETPRIASLSVLLQKSWRRAAFGEL